MSELEFVEAASLGDLGTFFQRIGSVGFPEVLLVARPHPAGGSVLAVYGCTSASTSLLDPVPTVLIMRAASLQGNVVLDRVVEIRALTDRLARLDEKETTLPLPPTDMTAVWTGIKPPVTGWESVGSVDADSLRDVARTGIERVAAALPESPGAAVVEKIRAKIWGQEIMPGIPAAAALAGETMGFFEDQARVRLLQTAGWYRLDCEQGDILVRRNF